MMDEANPEIDRFLANTMHWREEFRALRRIALGTGLAEEMKWGWPCYRLNGKNVVLMHGFKDYCALLFIKGALLEDRAGILTQATENVQAGRQARFASVAEIAAKADVLRAYIDEAIALERADAKVAMKRTRDFPVTPEFQARLEEDADLRTAFAALTPGRQRAYLLHFSTPKQAKTRVARVERFLGKIRAGKGLDD